MKMKALFLSLLWAMLSSVAFAQNGYVIVTATVPTYAGGQATSSFQNQSSLPQLPLLNGSIFATHGVQNMDSSGHFTMVLADNTIVQPNPSQWQIIICAKPGNVGQPCYPVTITITCVNNGACVNGTLDISSAFAGAPAPPLPPGSLPIAFWPGQILTSTAPGVNYALQPQIFYSQAGDTIASIESRCSTVCTYFVTRPQTITLSSNHTLASTVNVYFLNGGLWTVLGSSTLTIPSHVNGVLSQHFAGNGNISLTSQMLDGAPVEWFGAIGDWNGSSGTDNTTHIQACINAVTSGPCTLLAQSYMTSAPLSITKSNVGLAGVATGIPNAGLYPTPSASQIIITSATADILDVSGTSTSSNITYNKFTNFTLARNQAPGTNAAGLRLSFSYGAMIDSVTSLDSTAGFLFKGVGSQGTGYIQNSAAAWGYNGFTETSGSLAGFQIDSTSGVASASLRIRDSFVAANPALTGTTTYGLLSNGSAMNDLMVDHLETATTNYGVFLQSSGGPSTDIHLINGINDGCITTCIYIQGISGAAEVSGGWNFRQSSASPVIDIRSSSHIDITGLQIFYPNGAGVGLSALTSGGLRVVHNDFIVGGGSAVFFTNVSASTVTGNVMNGITATSIVNYVNSPGNAISSNTINGTATNGIFLDTTSCGIGGLETNQIGSPALGTITNLVNSVCANPLVAAQGLQVGLNGSTYKIRQGIRASGSPLCSAAANGSCTFTLTFTQAFPNATWAGQCNAETSTGAGVITAVAETGKTTTTATVTFRDLSGATNALSTAICEGWE
jgi:hypothetical protein